MGNTAKQCRLGLFQDSDFAGDLEDSKSTSGGTLCIFGSHTFVPISWMCKKQTSVSHSSTESEIISLDTGLRLHGLPALELWDLIVSVLGNTIQIPERPGRLVVTPQTSSLRIKKLCCMCLRTTKQGSRFIKGRSPTMRHVSRTHRVALDWWPLLVIWRLQEPRVRRTTLPSLQDLLKLFFFVVRNTFPSRISCTFFFLTRSMLPMAWPIMVTICSCELGAVLLSPFTMF